MSNQVGPGYRDLVLGILAGDRTADSLAVSIETASAAVLSALEAYRKARRGQRVALTVPVGQVRWNGVERGTLLLRWREEEDLACRMERVGEGLSATVDFRIDGQSLVLTMLDENAQPERVDEL